MSEERWLPVVGYEGLYEVSDHGRVRSLVKRTAGRRERVLRVPRMLKATKRAPGNYMVVGLVPRGGAVKTMYLHRVVLTAFVGPAPPRHQAAHGDGIRENCRLDNLRWATAKENCADKAAHGTKLVGESLVWAKLTEDQVRAIRSKPRTNQSYRDQAESLGVSWQAVAKVATGATWKHV